MSTALTVPVPTEIQAIHEEVQSLTITTPQAFHEASDLMVRLRKTRKMAEEALKVALKPLKDQIKAEQDRANVGLTLLVNAEGTLQRGILEYQRKAREEMEKKQAQELAKYEKKVAKLEAKAEASGAPVPLIAPPPVIAAPPSSVETDSGLMMTRKVKKWRIIDVQQIPDEYWSLNEVMIGKVVRAGVEIPGIQTYEEESLSIR